MTMMAWIFMLSAWSLILACTLYCFCKLMCSKCLETSESND